MIVTFKSYATNGSGWLGKTRAGQLKESLSGVQSHPLVHRRTYIASINCSACTEFKG